MTIPGFAAETSVYTATGRYRMCGTTSQDSGHVRPAAYDIFTCVEIDSSTSICWHTRLAQPVLIAVTSPGGLA